MKSNFTAGGEKMKIEEYTLCYRHRKGTSDIAIVFLHGYPTSSLDYKYIWDLIPQKYTLVAHDHLGFGKSDKPVVYDYSLIDQAQYALQLYKKIGIDKVHIVAHDYGTSVATEIVARNNESLLDIDIQSVTLCNGSMLIDMAKLRPIQRLLKSKITGSIIARLSSRKVFHRNMRNIWYDKFLYKESEMDLHWNLLIDNNGRSVLPKITRYIDQRYKHYDRWIGGLNKTESPVHILWAANDPIAVVAMADKLEPMIANSYKTIIDNCGHYPMIEQPKKWTKHLLAYISRMV